MVKGFINSKLVRLFFALSVSAFTLMQISHGETIIMVINVFFSFALTLCIEWKYKILEKLFAGISKNSRKYIFIALPIAVYAVIEMTVNFHNRRALWLLTSETSPITAVLENLFSQQLLNIAVYAFSAAVGVVSLFGIFAVTYALISRFTRFREFAVKVWTNAELSERIYFFSAVSVLGILTAAAYSLSPTFWGDFSLPGRGIDHFFGLDVGLNIGDDAQFYFPSGHHRRLFYPLINFPLALIARAIGRASLFYPIVYIYTLQLFHIALMALSAIMLARMCKTTGLSKIFFLMIYSVSFPFLVFSIPLERYILPTFCIILLMYACIYMPKIKYPAALAAAGTLSTSGIALPFVTFSKDIKTWLSNLLKIGGILLAITIICGMLPILTNPAYTLFLQLDTHAVGVSIGERALQFYSFVKSVFLRPETIVGYGIRDGIEFATYIVAEPLTVNWIGVILIAVSIVGFLINRKLKFAQMASLWALFTFFSLFIVGWYSVGNEMFMGSLYFGWSFFVLVFLFFEKLLEKQKIVKYIVYSTVFLVMGIINTGGIIDLIRFGIEHYPPGG